MKHLIIILFLTLTCSVFGQANKILGTAVTDSTDSLSAGYFGYGEIITGVQFPAAMTADTVFIQTADADTLYTDVYYTYSTGAQVRMHLVVQAGKVVGINPLWREILRAYIRIASDTAEGDDRTFTFLGH